MRVVLDADCLIAGVLTREGATSEILNRWLHGTFELVVCPHLIREVRKALLHPRIAGKYGITHEDVEALSLRLSEEGSMLDDPSDPPRVVRNDPGDDYLVALALAADADCLVTRDQHFRDVEVEDVPILTPRSFMEKLEG